MKPHDQLKRAAGKRIKHLWCVGALAGVLALSMSPQASALPQGSAAVAKQTPADQRLVIFTDAHRQATEFISYDRSITLTAAQKKLMDEALSSIPAPCCAQYSIASCCCPCNLAKSVWGLSKSLIARQRATAAQVSAAATEWLHFTNPAGYTGDACFTGGCNRSFGHNGCGGMDDRHVR